MNVISCIYINVNSAICLYELMFIVTTISLHHFTTTMVSNKHCNHWGSPSGKLCPLKNIWNYTSKAILYPALTELNQPCTHRSSDPLHGQRSNLSLLSMSLLHLLLVERLFSVAGRVFRPDRCLKPWCWSGAIVYNRCIHQMHFGRTVLLSVPCVLIISK